MSEDLMEEMAIYASMGCYGNNSYDIERTTGMDATTLGALGGMPELGLMMMMGGGSRRAPHSIDDDDDDDDDDVVEVVREGKKKKVSPPKELDRHCDMCDCTIPVSKEGYKAHVTGKRHLKRQAELQACDWMVDDVSSLALGAKRSRADMQPGVSKKEEGGKKGKAGAAAPAKVTPAIVPYVECAFPHLFEAKKGSYGMTRGDLGKTTNPKVTINTQRPDSDAEVSKLLRLSAVAAATNVVNLGRACSGSSLVTLAAATPHLQLLDLCGCSKVTGEDLVAVARQCRYLEVIDAKQVSNFSTDHFMSLVNLLPRLKYFDARDTRFGGIMAGECPPRGVNYQTVLPGLLLDL